MPVLSGKELLATLRKSGDPGAVEVHDFCRMASPQIEPAHWLDLRALAQSLLDRKDKQAASKIDGQR